MADPFQVQENPGILDEQIPGVVEPSAPSNPAAPQDQQQQLLAQIPGVDEPFEMPKRTPAMRYIPPDEELKARREKKAEDRQIAKESRKSKLPPSNPDYFRAELEMALDNPGYQQLPPEEQVRYIHKIFDTHPDQRFNLLPPKERLNYVRKQVDQFREEAEYMNSIPGQFEMWWGDEVSPAITKPLEWIDKVPGVRTALSEFFGRAGQEAIGAKEEGLATDIQLVQNTFKDGLIGDKVAIVDFIDRATQGLIPDDQFEKLEDWAYKEVKTPKFLESDLDVVNHILDNAKSGLRKQAKIQFESAGTMPTSQHLVNGLPEELASTETLDWFGQLFGGSMAHLAPDILAMNLAGANTLVPFMQPGMTGMAKRDAAQRGVELSDEAAAGIGLANAYFESLFGAEGVIGAGPLREMYKKLLKGGAARVVRRAAVGSTLEGVTEVMQDFVTMQAANWTKGEEQLWGNLSPDDKDQLIQSFIGGVALGLPFEAYSNFKRGVHEKRVANVYEKLGNVQEKMRVDQLDPRQRGRETGTIPPVAKPELTEGGVGEMRLRSAPEFIGDDDAELLQQWTDGTYTLPENYDKLGPEQRQQAWEKEVEIQDQISPAPKPVKIETPEHDLLMAGLKQHILDNMSGHATQQEQQLLASETLRWVEPQEEEIQELAGAIENVTGVRPEFFTYDGRARVNGMVGSKNVMAIRYKGRTGYNAMAATVIHELVHNSERRMPGVFRSLRDTMREMFPEEWAKSAQVAQEKNKGKTQAHIEEEELAYFAGANAEHIINYINNAAELSQKAEAPRGLRKAWESFKRTILDLARSSKFVRDATGLKGTEEIADSAVEQKVAQMGKIFAQLFESGTKAQGAATVLPETVEFTPSKSGGRVPAGFEIANMADIKPGDVIRVPGQSSSSAYTVESVTPVADDNLRLNMVRNNDGVNAQAVIQSENAIYKESPVPAAPEPAPAPATPEPEPVSEPVEPVSEPVEPEPQPERKGKKKQLEDEHGQGTLFSEEFVASELGKINLLREQPETAGRDDEVDGILKRLRDGLREASAKIQEATDSSDRQMRKALDDDRMLEEMLKKYTESGEVGTVTTTVEDNPSEAVDADTDLGDEDYLARVLRDYDEHWDSVIWDGEEVMTLDDEPFGDFNASMIVEDDALSAGRIEGFDSNAWNKYGEQYGVSGLGGLGELEDFVGVMLPGGGAEGEWTFEELLWIQSQAYDPNTWTEEQHAQVIRKLHRTLTPKEMEPLQALNQFIFAMISPQLNLTSNEIFYSLFRVRNAEEVKQWVARLPWDVTEGETPGREVYDRLEDGDKDDFAQWYAEIYKKKKTPRGEAPYREFVAKYRAQLERLSDKSLGKRMRDYYSDKIKWEFGGQKKKLGGLGFSSTQPLANIAEMAQFFQKDPDWFVKDPAESWHVFTKRIASQFNGLSNKTAMFGGVWQDPLLASVAAIDRHMAELFRETIIDAVGRKKFEEKVLKAWKEKKGEQYRAKLKKKGITDEPTLFDYSFDHDAPISIDEIFRTKGGAGFAVDMLLTEVSKPIKRKYKFNPDRVRQYIREPKNEVNVGRAYMAALNVNAAAAKKLGLGFFSYQHMAWDRQRRRLETHAAMYPGLYKLPHMNPTQFKRVFEMANKYDRILTGREQVIGEDNEREFRLKRAKPAPLGDLTFVDEAPVHTPPGDVARPGYVVMANDAAVDAEQAGPMFEMPGEPWMVWLRRKMQDKFVRVEQLQKKIVETFGVPIREDMDVYLYEMLYHGRAAARIEDFEAEHLEPLRGWLRENSIDIDKFEEWLHARHAGERNSRYKEIYQTKAVEAIDAEMNNLADQILDIDDQGGDATVLQRKWNRLRRKREKLLDADLPTSGMTDDEAAAILDATGTDFDEGGKLFDEMMDQKLEILLEYGLIDQDLYDKLKDTYKYYAPLKGKEYEGDLESILDHNGWSVGSGFDIRGDEVGQSFGRVDGDKPTKPILAQAVLDIEEAIIRAEKNEVGKAFKRLVEEFPSDNLYQVSKRVRRRVLDRSTGQVKFVADALAKKQANVFAVKEDGETYYIYVKDSRLATALKNIGNGNRGPFIRLLGAANRLMAKLSTTLNPEFMVANFARDIQTAMTHLNQEEAQGIMKETLGNLAPAMRGIAGAEGIPGASRTEWSDVYDEFSRAGGKIGFFGYSDVLSTAKAIERSIRRQGPGPKSWTFRNLYKLGNLIESGNTVVENGIRLATFKTAMDNGMSPKKAARLARRLTVNFNKKGEWGSTMNAVWLFSNASIQGTSRMFTALATSRKVRKLAASMYVASFALAALNDGMGGEDDEDGMTYWDKLPDWQKETNLIFMLPGTKGNHIKIPLPYGYNVFNVLGTQSYKIASRTWRGQLKATDIPAAGLQVFDAMVGAFNPLGSTRLDSAWGVMRFAVPSIAAPVADTLVNETYYGAPIQPTRSSWDKSPASSRYFEGVTPLARKLTEWANEATGGNAYQPGAVDVNPEILDYLVGSYAGGGAKTAKRMLFDLPMWAFKDRLDLSKIEANDVAFLRRVYGEMNDHTVASMYYEYIEEIQQAKAAWDNLSKDPGFDRLAWEEKHGWKKQLFKELSRVQTAIRKESDPEKKNKLRKEFNRKHREAWESQF